MDGELIKKFNYQDYCVEIFAENPDDEDTGIFFQIFEFNENNIICDWPLYDSSKDYILDNVEDAEANAINYIDCIDDICYS